MSYDHEETVTSSGGGVLGQSQQPQFLKDERGADEETGKDGQEQADVEVLHLLGRGFTIKWILCCVGVQCRCVGEVGYRAIWEHLEEYDMRTQNESQNCQKNCCSFLAFYFTLIFFFC